MNAVDPTLLILLRGINVSGHKKVPMAELRALATDLGLADVRTYIASGNLLCTAERPLAEVVPAVEAGIRDRFGFHVDVVGRTADRWFDYAAGSPFPDAEQDRPNLLHLGVAAGRVNADAGEALAPYAGPGDRIAIVEDALWIDFASGVARSKLTPSRLDRAVGTPVTGRNWRTVQKLAAMIRGD